MSWTKDKRWSDQFIPVITQCLSSVFVKPASLPMDQQENTDLMVMDVRQSRVACRVRDVDYSDRYPFDITVRAVRRTGAVTEWDKMRDGFGDYMFYGFGIPGERPRLARWVIVDLSRLRQFLAFHEGQKTRPWSECRNAGENAFIALDTRKLRRHNPKIIFASSRTVEYWEDEQKATG